MACQCKSAFPCPPGIFVSRFYSRNGRKCGNQSEKEQEEGEYRITGAAPEKRRGNLPAAASRPSSFFPSFPPSPCLSIIHSIEERGNRRSAECTIEKSERRRRRRSRLRNSYEPHSPPSTLTPLQSHQRYSPSFPSCNCQTFGSDFRCNLKYNNTNKFNNSEKQSVRRSLEPTSISKYKNRVLRCFLALN